MEMIFAARSRESRCHSLLPANDRQNGLEIPQEELPLRIHRLRREKMQRQPQTDPDLQQVKLPAPSVYCSCLSGLQVCGEGVEFCALR